jgi:hypothetical protein
MTHLTHEDLVLRYYDETSRDERGRIEDHLASCEACRQSFAELQRMLELIDAAPGPEPRPGFERDVWARLEPRLGERRVWWSGWLSLPAWGLAGGAGVLLVATFFAGREWGSAPPARPAPPALQAEGEPERVLRAAVGDHLDRSQRMLVELLNSDAPDADRLVAEQARAADLVAASRLYRLSAEQAGDAAIADILDDLERVLIEIANAPSDPTSNEMAALRSRIADQDLLFRVRVVAAEMRARQRQGTTDDSNRRREPIS